MIEPDVQRCPRCRVHKLDLEFKPRIIEREDDTAVYSVYKACECYALTYSPKSGQYNLRDECAQEFGIKKAVLKPMNRVAQPVPFKIRRNGKVV